MSAARMREAQSALVEREAARQRIRADRLRDDPRPAEQIVDRASVVRIDGFRAARADIRTPLDHPSCKMPAHLKARARRVASIWEAAQSVSAVPGTLGALVGGSSGGGARGSIEDALMRRAEAARAWDRIAGAMRPGVAVDTPFGAMSECELIVAIVCEGRRVSAVAGGDGRRRQAVSLALEAALERLGEVLGDA